MLVLVLLLQFLGGTSGQYPSLRKIYDTAFVSKLIALRSKPDNYLLFLLVNPGLPSLGQFWSEVERDLNALAAEGSYKHFTPKFRERGRYQVEGYKTELEMAAWMKRKGYGITLEPEMAGTGARPEFHAASVPPTWWEVKSPLDDEQLLEIDRVYAELQTLFKRIPEPYILHCSGNVKSRDVRSAVSEIRPLIERHYKEGGSLPTSFRAKGLVVDITGLSRRDHGFMGSSNFGYCFTTEQMDKVKANIKRAVRQLPAEGGGVVVIDCSQAHGLNREDVVDACFGEDKLAHQGGRLFHVREHGSFKRNLNTRLSALMWYRRTDQGSELVVERVVYHNPHASVVVPPDVFRAPGITRRRRVEIEPGRFRLEHMNGGSEADQ